jgi:hypothetical protein
MMSQTERDSEELQVAPSDRRLIKPLVGSTEELVMEVKESEVPAERVHQEENSGNISLEKMDSTSSTSGQPSTSSELKRPLASERLEKSSDEAASDGGFSMLSSSQMASSPNNAAPIVQDQTNLPSTQLVSQNSTFISDREEIVATKHHFTPDKGARTEEIQEEAEKERENSMPVSNQVQSTCQSSVENERSEVGAETPPGPTIINQKGPTLRGKEVNKGPPKISAGEEEPLKQDFQSEHKEGQSGEKTAESIFPEQNAPSVISDVSDCRVILSQQNAGKFSTKETRENLHDRRAQGQVTLKESLTSSSLPTSAEGQQHSALNQVSGQRSAAHFSTQRDINSS